MDADSTIVSQESRGQGSFNSGYTMGSVNVKCTIFDKEDTKMVEIGLLILDFVVDFFLWGMRSFVDGLLWFDYCMIVGDVR